ncbi:MAG: aryl-sulfate sulfotransferase [Alphaproteobacteria bacterium]|nr:aryl-sulfate sulfotransferase [Alphaproteobacteria bacterium]
MRILQTGITVHDRDRATPGFTIYSPHSGHVTYLIDMDGKIVHQWTLPDKPSGYARLLPGGNLFYACFVEGGPPLKGGGKGGLIREVDWDNNLVHEHTDLGQHHDFRKLANGNILYPGWEKLGSEVAQRIGGGRPGTEMDDGSIWGDYIREVDQDGETVWQWRVAEDMDLESFPLHPTAGRRVYAWCNAIFPLPNGEVLASLRLLNTVVIIERESKSFRWSRTDESWGFPHDCQMLENGNIMLFANGFNSINQHSHSRIVEFNPETGEDVWVYQADPLNHFYSHHISGAQRLASGNTLICEGAFGRLFEVTPEGEIVWEYINPQFDKSFDGQSVNWVFRAYRYAPDSPELAGRL